MMVLVFMLMEFVKLAKMEFVDNDVDNDGVCDVDEVLGCQDSTACNYNVLATDDDT